MIKKITRFIPALIWMLIIFYFSSKETTGIGGSNQFYRFIFLKSLHLIEYAFLSFLLLFANLDKKTTIVFSYLYALSDEIHQSFTPGRIPKFRDTFIDLIGIFIGVYIYSFVAKKTSNFKFLSKKS